MSTTTPKNPKTSKSQIYRILFTIALIGLVVISALPLTSPRAVPADAPAERFSAERAMADLAVVAKEPHAAGSPAQAKVRDYILAQAAALGQAAEVQKSGQVENIIVRLPGSDSTGTVLITGHYDSQPPSPGAGDDGISPAAMLETMRMLSASPALRNDIVFLFSDGEENSYLGSKAYLKDFPEAKDQTGVLLCFDGLPGNGPLTLTETSPKDAWLVRELSASRPALLANSRFNSEERGEIDTDCTIFFASGYHGFEFENHTRGTLYHTAGDTVDAISPRLVQSFGNTMERSARHFGDLDLAQAEYSGDVDFFSAPLVSIARYPTWLTTASAILAMLAFVGLVAAAVLKKKMAIGRSLLGALGFLAAALLITALAALAWQALLAIFPTSRQLTLDYLDFAGSTGWKTGMLLVSLALGILALFGLSRKVNIAGLTAGGILVFMLVWWLAYIAMDSDNPLTTPHLAWTLLGGVAGLAALLFARKPIWLLVCLFLAAIPILVVVTPVIVLLTYQEPWISILGLVLVLGIMIPQLAVIMGWLPLAAEEGLEA
jgi:hypothetical protein